MTVKELIINLLECNMSSEVSIELKTDQNSSYTIAESFRVVDYVGGVVIEEV